MIDAVSILDMFAERHADRRGSGANGTVTYLDGLLAESVDHLTQCARNDRVNLIWREALVSVVHDVCEIKRRLNAPRGADVGGVPVDRSALPAMTRAVVSDLARNGLFVAFRDRCTSLSARLYDPDGAEAAVAELVSGVKVLARYVG